ncbi:Melanoma-associated antigen 8, partial [Camelus dromedarius]
GSRAVPQCRSEVSSFLPRGSRHREGLGLRHVFSGHRAQEAGSARTEGSQTTVHQEESPCEAEGTPEEETSVAAPPWSQSEDNGLRSQGEEGPSTGQDPADAESRLHDALHLMMVDLMGFLLHKYRTKQPTSKEEMLNAVLRDDQDHFPAVLSQASECLQLVFGEETPTEAEFQTGNPPPALPTALGDPRARGPDVTGADAPSLGGERGAPDTGRPRSRHVFSVTEHRRLAVPGLKVRTSGCAGCTLRSRLTSPSVHRRPHQEESPCEAEGTPEEETSVAPLPGASRKTMASEAKQPTSKEEMLNAVLRDDQDHFPAVLSQASECLQLVFGVDVKEVDPREHLYVLVPTLASPTMAWTMGEHPKTGLLLILLGVIVLEGDFAPEEAVWGALSKMGLCAGREHFIYGEPRELITNVWVREGYVEYRQVANSDPARHEFLWGPRAYTETSKLQVLEHFLRINRRGPSFFPSLSEERVSDEEEGA